MSSSVEQKDPFPSAFPVRGVFILLEGPDKCGKTTQCVMLAKHLREKSIPVCEMHFPIRDSPTGAVVNQFLKSEIELDYHSSHLLFSANRWDEATKIVELLKSGINIIMDRYAYSGSAYSHAAGVNLKWCKGPDAGLPAPDLVFLFQTDPESQSKCTEWGDERNDITSFQEKVADSFNLLVDDRFVMIDAKSTIDAIHKRLVRTTEVAIRHYKNDPIRILWNEMLDFKLIQ